VEELLPQVSVAVIVKALVHRQPLFVSALVTLRLALPQVELALIPLVTLLQVGRLAGLQPKLLLVGVPLIVGGVVFTVQL
jgi:hypothetical protein